jgi:hypothetical protein
MTFPPAAAVMTRRKFFGISLAIFVLLVPIGGKHAAADQPARGSTATLFHFFEPERAGLNDR